jgi:amino acid adenylation domain-containing protein
LWVKLDALPLTANGKLDRRSLPAPAVETGGAYVAPRTQAEQVLASIWQELLKADQVGINDNFFELGGHSLLVMRVLSAIRTRLQVELQVRDIFDHPTIAGLGALLHERSAETLLPALVRQPRNGRIPLSYSQERLYFIDKLEGSIQYHIPVVLKLKGELNIAALSASLKTILDRHEALRTVFYEDNGQVYQTVQEHAGWDIVPVDGTMYKENETELDEKIQELASQVFDLSSHPLLRVHLIRLHEKEHVLIMTIHHISSDGWSAAILTKELVELYTSSLSGRTPMLPDLDVQYADYALWQRDYLNDNILQEKLNYWAGKLKGVATLELPLDFPRPLIHSTRGAVSMLEIGSEITESLKALSNQNGTTLFMTMLTAFKVLLHRYSGQTDICIGTPVANRGQHEIEGLIGFFVNTIALRSDLSGNPSFTGLLQKEKDSILEGYRYQDAPFEKVVDAVVGERDAARNPLFQVMFVLQNRMAADIDKNALSDLSFSVLSPKMETSKFDLTFTLIEVQSGLGLVAEYNTDLFTVATIEAMCRHYRQLLVSALQNPATPIGQLRMLDAEEEKELLFTFNNTNTEYHREDTIVSLFGKNVSKSPQAVALVYDGKQLSYEEVDAGANLIAGYLKQRGINKGTIVPVCMPRSADLVIAMLGIMKAGGAYVPVDPNNPKEHIAYVLEDTACKMVLCTTSVKERLPEAFGGEVFVTDAAIADSNLQEVVPPNAADLAYVIYTSGSSGKPKGVLVKHGGLVNLVHWHIREYEVSASSKCTAMAGVAFDAFGWEVWPYLSSGAAVYLLCDEERGSLTGLVSLCDSECITHSFLSTALVNEFMDLTRHKPMPLKYLLTGGDALHTVDTKGINYCLVNNYGPTENSVVTTSYKVNRAGETRRIPIGKPIANTRVYVLDANGELCPKGVPGELCISGDGLAEGYLNLPGLTSEKFIKDPFHNNGLSIVYRSGDLVKWLPDGNLAFLGRIDAQVKIRGYRVEPGEIEVVLQQSGLVKQVAVIAVTDNRNVRNLVACIVSEAPLNKEVIKEYLLKKLPEYMVPAIIIELDSLPLTTNGKVDRRQLAEINYKQERNNNGSNEPRNDTERKLAAIYVELLELETIGIYDNFFELGGHSLLAIKAVVQVKKELNVNLSITKIFQFPTIATLAEYLELVAVEITEEKESEGEFDVFEV